MLPSHKGRARVGTLSVFRTCRWPVQEREEQAMQVIHPRCAGLDVHEKTVVATAMITEEDGTMHKQQRTFRTMTADLLTLDDWLEQQQIQVIAMESTGIYWRPGFNILKARPTVIIVNARHM